MSKTQVAKIVILSVVITWLLNILVGRFFVAKISTLPILNRWHILSPQAPIVITNRETVRVSDSGDVMQAASDIKSKISTVVLANNGSDSVAGAAVNLTSDGSFVTAAGTFTKTVGTYYVILSDGTSGKVTAKVADPATSLVFFKADLNNVPVASLGNSGDASVGEKILFAANSLEDFTDKVSASTVSSAQADVGGQTYQADYPRRGFSAESDDALLSGEVVADTSANILGIWNGGAIISSDVLKDALNLYLAGGSNIIRPSFGFSYSVITQNESAITGQTPGALVKDISGPAAKQAGLEAGDIITTIDGNAISETSPLEEYLANYKPGDKITLAVIRKNQALNLTLVAGELKQ